MGRKAAGDKFSHILKVQLPQEEMLEIFNRQTPSKRLNHLIYPVKDS